MAGYTAVPATWRASGQGMVGASVRLASAVDRLCRQLNAVEGCWGDDDIGRAFFNGDAKAEGFGAWRNQVLAAAADAVNLVRATGGMLSVSGRNYAVAEDASTVGGPRPAGADQGALATLDPYRLPSITAHWLKSDPEPPGHVQMLRLMECLVGGCQLPDGNLAGLAAMRDAFHAAARAIGEVATEVRRHVQVVTADNAGAAAQTFASFADALIGGADGGGLQWLSSNCDGLGDWVDTLIKEKRAARLQFNLSVTFLSSMWLAAMMISAPTGGGSITTALAVTRAEAAGLRAMIWRIVRSMAMGAVFSGGMDMAGQFARRSEGLQTGYDWTELAKAGGEGAIAGLVMGGAHEWMTNSKTPFATAVASYLKAGGFTAGVTRFGLSGVTGTAGNVAGQAAIEHRVDLVQAAEFGFGMAGIESAKEVAGAVFKSSGPPPGLTDHVVTYRLEPPDLSAMNDKAGADAQPISADAEVRTEYGRTTGGPADIRPAGTRLTETLAETGPADTYLTNAHLTETGLADTHLTETETAPAAGTVPPAHAAVESVATSAPHVADAGPAVVPGGGRPSLADLLGGDTAPPPSRTAEAGLAPVEGRQAAESAVDLTTLHRAASAEETNGAPAGDILTEPPGLVGTAGHGETVGETMTETAGEVGPARPTLESRGGPVTHDATTARLDATAPHAPALGPVLTGGSPAGTHPVPPGHPAELRRGQPGSETGHERYDPYDDLDEIDLLRTLPQQQREAVERLVADGGVRRLNEALGSDDPHLRAEAQTWARNAVEGLQVLPDEAATLYHYTSMSADRQAELRPGADVTMSTMLDAQPIHTPEHGRPVELIIRSRTGKDLSPLTGQDQIVFAPETRFRVLAVEHVELPVHREHEDTLPIHRVFLAELPQDGSPLPGTAEHSGPGMTRRPLDGRLQNVYDRAREYTDAGVSYFDPADPRSRLFSTSAKTVRPIDGVFSFDLHTDTGLGQVGRDWLDGADLAALLGQETALTAPRGSDRPVILRSLGCNSGRGPHSLAQTIANETGRIVIAPDAQVWVDIHGTAQVSKPNVGPDGQPRPTRFPPEGAWHIFIPEEGHRVPAFHDRPAPPEDHGGARYTGSPHDPALTHEPPPALHELRRTAPGDGTPDERTFAEWGRRAGEIRAALPPADVPYGGRVTEMAGQLNYRTVFDRDASFDAQPAVTRWLRSALEFTHEPTGIHTEVTGIEYGEDSFRVVLGLVDRGNASAGRAEAWVFTNMEGRDGPVGHYVNFEITSADHQGRGLGTELQHRLENWYIGQGVDVVTTLTDVESPAGRYAFARSGFTFDDRQSFEEVVGHFRANEGRMSEAGRQDWAALEFRLTPEAFDLHYGVTAYELSRIGWADRRIGADGRPTWDGRQFLLEGPAWRGQKHLLPAEEGEYGGTYGDPSASYDGGGLDGQILGDRWQHLAHADADMSPAAAAPPGERHDAQDRQPSFEEWGDRAAAIRATLPPDGLPYDGNLRDFLRTAAPGDPLPTEIRHWLHSMLEFDHPQSGLRMKIRFSDVDFENALYLMGELVDSAGEHQGLLRLTLYPEGEAPYLNIDRVEIVDNSQGRGVMAGLVEHWGNWLIGQGIHEMRVEANIDAGGYAWLRYGFDFDPRLGYEESGLKEIVAALNRAARHGELSAEGLRDWEALAHRATEAAWNTPDRITAQEIGRIGWDARRLDGRHLTWDGKAILRLSKWQGVLALEPSGRHLDPPSDGPNGAGGHLPGTPPPPPTSGPSGGGRPLDSSSDTYSGAHHGDADLPPLPRRMSAHRSSARFATPEHYLSVADHTPLLPPHSPEAVDAMRGVYAHTLDPRQALRASEWAGLRSSAGYQVIRAHTEIAAFEASSDVEVRRIKVAIPGGTERTITEYTLRIKLLVDPGTTMSDEEFVRAQANARNGVDLYYNHQHTLRDGSQFHLRLEFVQAEPTAAASARVTLRPGQGLEAGDRIDVINWHVDMPLGVFAHEIGHHLDFGDEYGHPGRLYRRTLTAPETQVDGSLMAWARLHWTDGGADARRIHPYMLDHNGNAVPALSALRDRHLDQLHQMADASGASSFGSIPAQDIEPRTALVREAGPSRIHTADTLRLPYHVARLLALPAEGGAPGTHRFPTDGLDVVDLARRLDQMHAVFTLSGDHIPLERLTGDHLAYTRALVDVAHGLYGISPEVPLSVADLNRLRLLSDFLGPTDGSRPDPQVIGHQVREVLGLGPDPPLPPRAVEGLARLIERFVAEGGQRAANETHAQTLRRGANELFGTSEPAEAVHLLALAAESDYPLPDADARTFFRAVVLRAIELHGPGHTDAVIQASEVARMLRLEGNLWATPTPDDFLDLARFGSAYELRGSRSKGTG